MFGEIYDYEERLRRYRRVLSGLRQGDLALSFLDHLAAMGSSKASLSDYAAHIAAILRAMDFNPSEATRRDVEKLVAWVNRQPYRESTKRKKKLVLKRFIKYAKLGTCSRDAAYPPEVSWIKLSNRGGDSRVKPENLLKPDEFEALLKAAENSRDRAMLYVLFEGALRPGEILSMTVGSVQFKEGYCIISVNGKTGLKMIPLVVSFKPLLEWIEDHPEKDDPNAPLWCSLATNYKGKRLSYRHFRLIIKRIAKKAGLRKDVWPYLFRHSMLTALAKVFTEAKLEKYAGWVHGSRMASRYVHFSARDLEDAVLELHGMKKSKGSGDFVMLVECPRCGDKNPPGNVRCGFCGYILDREFAFKVELEEEREKRRREEMIIERIERLERIVYRMLGNPEVKRQE